MPKLSVKTNPEHSFIGPAKFATITEVVVTGLGNRALIEVAGKKGHILENGRMGLTVEAMDQLARKWLEQRGLLPAMPDHGFAIHTTVAFDGPPTDEEVKHVHRRLVQGMGRTYGEGLTPDECELTVTQLVHQLDK